MIWVAESPCGIMPRRTPDEPPAEHPTEPSSPVQGVPAAPQCPGRTATGAPCTKPPRAGGWCYWHDPATAGRRTSSTRAGWREDRAPRQKGKRRLKVNPARELAKRAVPPGPRVPAPPLSGDVEVRRLAGRVPTTVADILELVSETSLALVEGRISKSTADVVLAGAKFQARLLRDVGKGSADAKAVAAALGITIEEAAGMTEEDLGRELAKMRAGVLAPPEEQPS